MGKRSDFPRRAMDNYETPIEAVGPLLPFLRSAGVETFAEPCCGAGKLVDHLEGAGFRCVYQNDLRLGVDALATGAQWFAEADVICTNPPWTRELLHPLITHFMCIASTWLLFDADWAHTRQAAPLMRYCSTIVSVGRVKWIPDSPFTGKDNAAWYRFDAYCEDVPTRFFGREEQAA